MILCSQAKLENDNKSLNVKRGLRAKIEQGLWPAVAPTGYLNERRTDRKGHILIDPQRAPMIKQMFEKVANENYSGRKLNEWLKVNNFKSRGGHPLSLSNIYTILRSTFYYGMMEYPAGSGKWYPGKHKPLINKSLFDKVQERLSRDNIVRSASKEFAFTKLMICGLCGSGITAEEKHKPLKDGSTRTYIYYGCARSKDLNCKNKYIREEEIVEQLEGIIDDIDINELGMKAKLEEETKRYQFFQTKILGIEHAALEASKEVNIKTYAKYLIKHGSVIDKRELLACLKSRLVLTKKIVSLQ
jgi:hypothetical protein